MYPGKRPEQKQFGFLRPNKFFLVPRSTNNSRLYCNGTNVWDYKPYYFNSYTVTPAPARFEDLITNWVGGEMLRVMVNTNRYQYLMGGFTWGIVALNYAGEETVAGVVCHHLRMELTGAKSSELWVAKGRAPHLVKYVARFPVETPVKGTLVHTETISGWKAGWRIQPEAFCFEPPVGAMLQPLGADQVEMSQDLRTGEKRVRFYSRDDADSEHIQALAVKGILEKYPSLTTNDLVFAGIHHFSSATELATVVARYELPKTAERRVVNGSTETKVQTMEVKFTPGGRIESVDKGVSVSFGSKTETRQ
jgi:hypothetical protein